jgi:hypothetical protein
LKCSTINRPLFGVSAPDEPLAHARGTVSKTRNSSFIAHLSFDIGHCRRKSRFNSQCSNALLYMISRFTDLAGGAVPIRRTLQDAFHRKKIYPPGSVLH